MTTDDKQPPTQELEAILESVKVYAALREKTDAEIADLLEAHVWAQMAGPQSDLVSEAIERLERSKGGPRPCEDDGLSAGGAGAKGRWQR